MLRCIFALLIAATSAVAPAAATYKPEYDKAPAAVRQWFSDAPLTPAARARLNYFKCCDHSDRLRTKFVGGADDRWSFYPDGDCTHAGCPLVEIPADVVHPEPIVPPAGADASAALEFSAMRREGVLFIYNGTPTCFWPPEPGL